MTYTIEYFIDKFEEIPDKNFRISYFDANKLDFILSFKSSAMIVSRLIIGGYDGFYGLAKTNKQRILLALEVERDLRDWRREDGIK